MNTPAPHCFDGHSRRKRRILPVSSTWRQRRGSVSSALSVGRSYFVILENSQFDFLVLVFVLLGCAVVLLLAFLTTTFQIEQNVESTFGFHAAFFQSQFIVQGNASQGQALLVGRNTYWRENKSIHDDEVRSCVCSRTFALFDKFFDIIDGLISLNIECQCSIVQRTYEDLHGCSFVHVSPSFFDDLQRGSFSIWKGRTEEHSDRQTDRQRKREEESNN